MPIYWWLIVLFVQILLPNSSSTAYATYLSLDISHPNYAPAVQAIINKAHKDLRKDRLFYIPNFLNPATVKSFADEVIHSKRIRMARNRTLFQDFGDFENFNTSSIRNVLLSDWIEYVPHSGLEQYASKHEQTSYIISMYEWPHLLRFWKSIVQQLLPDLYLSVDVGGSVYGLYGQKHDSVSWHFDESPFSCVFMIQKPEVNGTFHYIPMDNPLSAVENNLLDVEHTTDILWNQLSAIVLSDNNNSSSADNVEGMSGYSVDANAGDVYCFFGRKLLHSVTKMYGVIDRITVVMTYGEIAYFSNTLKSINEWTEKHLELCNEEKK